MPRYIVHIGPHKTGTTYLQVAFREVRSHFESRGILHPSQWLGDGVSHSGLFRRLREMDYELRREFAAFNRSEYLDILISSEDLFDLTGSQVNYLRELIGPHPVEIVFYCRRWMELIFSGWGEKVKHGYIGTFPQHLSAYMLDPFASHTLNFRLCLDHFKDCFGIDSIRLASYSNIVDEGLDLFVHFAKTFLRWADVPELSLARTNASPDPFDTEIVRALYALEALLGDAHSPDLSEEYQRRKENLKIADLLKAMKVSLTTIQIAENSAGLELLHEQLFRVYGSQLVEPRNRSLLFIPKLTSCSFVGQDYLLIPGSEGLLRELYNDVRASLYGSA